MTLNDHEWKNNMENALIESVQIFDTKLQNDLVFKKKMMLILLSKTSKKLFMVFSSLSWRGNSLKNQSHE